MESIGSTLPEQPDGKTAQPANREHSRRNVERLVAGYVPYRHYASPDADLSVRTSAIAGLAGLAWSGLQAGLCMATEQWKKTFAGKKTPPLQKKDKSMPFPERKESRPQRPDGASLGSI